MGTKQNKSPFTKATASDWIPNATWDKAPRGSKNLMSDKIIDMQLGEVVFDADGKIIAPGPSATVQGPHGTSKTSSFIDGYSKRGLEVVAFSAAVMLPTDWYGMIPKILKAQADGATDAELLADDATADEAMRVGRAMAANAQFALETHLSNRLIHDNPWALIIDEANRVQRVMLAAFMEVTVDGSVLGRVLENLACVTLLRNPPGEGYLGIAVGDLAFESRFPTFNLDENAFAWREWLAQQLPETDLKEFFSMRDGLDRTARRVFCPRVVEHTLRVTLEGLPPEIALPILPSGRQKIVNANGTDITEEVLRSTCEALGRPYRTASQYPGLVDKCRELSLEKGWNLHEVGPHGIGKTTTAKKFGATSGVPTVVVSASMADPSTFQQLVPMEGRMQPILADRVRFDGEPGLLVLDEFTLADKTVKPQMLEVTGPTRSLGSIPLNVKTIWALDNPARAGVVQYSGRTADEAMVSRFVLNLEVTEDDYDWRPALEGRFGEEKFKPFAEWRSQDLNADEKTLVAPRTLATMAILHKYGLDVDNALPYLGNERIPIRTHSLKMRLNDHVVLGLSAIVEDADEHLAVLLSQSPADLAGFDVDLDGTTADERQSSLEALKTLTANAILNAFSKADLVDLEPHKDVLVRIVAALPSPVKTAIISQSHNDGANRSEAKLKFWSEVYGEVRKMKKDTK